MGTRLGVSAALVRGEVRVFFCEGGVWFVLYGVFLARYRLLNTRRAREEKATDG